MAIARTPSELSIARTGSESSIGRGLARFHDPHLEAEFQVENFELSTRRFLRFSIALTSVVFLAYGVHDLLVVPSVHIQAWKLRYGIFLPVALGVMVLAQSRLMLRWHQLAVLVFGMAANVVVVWIGAISPPQGFYLYTSYVTLFVTLGPFIARMNVTTQAVYTLLSIALYNVFDAIFTHSPAEVRWSMSCTILAMGGIGVLAARQLELQARESFLQRRVIQRQVAELEVEKKKSDALLLNVLPAEIAQRLKTQSESIADGFAEVTVLFADIVGFTRLSEKLSPEDLVEGLNHVFSNFDDLVDKLKLEKIKTIGDAYMVAGGLHSREYDHCGAVAEMALAIQRRMADFSVKLGEPLGVRIGIHTGPVVAGVIGKKKFIYDIWGDTVNTASRMESHGEPGKIQVTDAVHERLKSLYELVPRGEIDVKGKGRMQTWYLLRRLPGAGGDVDLSETRLPWKA